MGSLGWYDGPMFLKSPGCLQLPFSWSRHEPQQGLQHFIHLAGREQLEDGRAKRALLKLCPPWRSLSQIPSQEHLPGHNSDMTLCHSTWAEKCRLLAECFWCLKHTYTATAATTNKSSHWKRSFVNKEEGKFDIRQIIFCCRTNSYQT